MMGITHAAAGGCAAAAAIPAVAPLVEISLTPTMYLAGVLIGAIGGILADTDHPDSVSSRGVLVGRKGSLLAAAGAVAALPMRLVGAASRQVFAHRGATHSFVFAVLWAVLAAPLYAVAAAGLVLGFACAQQLAHAAGLHFATLDPGPILHWIGVQAPAVMPLVTVAILAGYLSHLLADGVTEAPVQLFWPSARRVFLLPPPLRIATDGVVERILIRPAVILGAALVMAAHLGYALPPLTA